MKKLFILFSISVFLLCSCSHGNSGTSPITHEADKQIVGKWIDVITEQIVEYTDDGYYCEYINQSLGNDRTKYITDGGKIYYYLENDEPDMTLGIEYEIKDGHLIVAGALEYKPMDIKTE